MPKSQLVELYAHGLGVIDDARLEFGAGFNVLTGETGAGKTLLLGALDLCLGSDGASTRYAITTDLRSAAVFERQGAKDVVLSREAGSSGRLRCSIDGLPSSVEALRSMAAELIVIHGQHDSLNLRNRAEVLRIIDTSGGISTADLDEVRRRLSSVRRLRDEAGGDAARRDRELDFLRFQISEIEGASIAGPDELDLALEELTRLSELKEGQSALAEVVSRLDSDDDRSLLVQLAKAIELVPRSVSFDQARSVLTTALETAREGVHELAALSDPDAFDETEIEKLEERVGVLRTLARKYGGTLPQALATVAELRQEFQRLTEAAGRSAALDEEIVKLEGQIVLLAREARRERDYAAVRLTDAVRQQLPRVALSNASLRFVVDGDDGSDARILFTPNPGLPEGPLQALASGGELSRVLLALSLETAHEDVVAVFDEVDAGVGGEVAQQIGECLRELGRRQQVIAVTHLASVAAKADHHFVVEKLVDDVTTTTSVRKVEGNQRVIEIARMLAGSDLTDESKALARKLLETQR